MDLKQAFRMWSSSTRNLVLANRSRDAVNKILMKKWSDIELEQITETFARRIFSSSSESREMKVKAASILCYLLSWGADHGYCQRTLFGTEIVGDPEPPEVKVKPEALAKRQEELAAREEQKKEEPKNEETMVEQQKRPRGKQPRKVCQIDPDTLKVIREYDSIKEACDSVKIKKLDRALKNHSKAGDFYWAYKEEADTFKPKMPNESAPTQKKPMIVKKYNNRTTDKGNAVMKKEISEYSNDELIAELKRRGFKGTITISMTVEL